MSALYFQGRSDSAKAGKTMRGHKWIDTQFMFGDPSNPEVINVRLNTPVPEMVPTLWIDTSNARLPFKLVIDGNEVT